MQFPDDDNGNVLRRMQSHGDTLDYPREIDFTVVFPEANAANSFSNRFESLGYKTSVEFSQTAEGLPWDVLVVNHMMPTHEGIGAFEDALQQIAEPLGGRLDGWGCISGPPPTL